MAKILCIHDNAHQVALFADMLKRRGHHEVRTMVSELDVEELRAFAPDVVLVNLVRRVESLRSPIANFEVEIEGARILRAFLAEAIAPRPLLVLTGIAVEPKEVPADIPYAAFIEVPRQLEGLLACVDETLEHAGSAKI